MNKVKDMKKAIKPLIKECLTEILMEEGLLRIVKEHNLREGLEIKKQVIPENKSIIRNLQKESVQQKKQAIQETKKVFSSTSFDPFAGTDDIDTMELKAQEKTGVNVEKLFDSDMINSWNQQLELLEGKK